MICPRCPIVLYDICFILGQVLRIFGIRMHFPRLTEQSASQDGFDSLALTSAELATMQASLMTLMTSPLAF